MTERVLLVEDNQALADNVAEMLRDEDLSVAVCHDVESGEAEARARGFDLAIVDIRLAGADVGLDLVPKLHQINVHGEVLLITGNATLDTAIRAIRRGVYAYLTKPFEPDHLITLVKRALAQVALKREKHALAQRLAASEALYRSVVESVESCILGIDVTGTIRFCNRFAADRLNGGGEGLLGRSFVKLWSTDEQSKVEHNLRRALRGAAIRDYECSLDRHEKRRRIRWTLAPLTAPGLSSVPTQESSSSDLPVVLAAGIDVTDRLELERKTAEAEAMAAMGTLTTALAHEIRNPLNAAKLQLELLERRARKLSDKEARAVLSEPAEIVRAEINRLGSLLDEFLDLARPRQIERRTLVVGELFDEVIKLEQPLLERNSVSLHTSIEPRQLTLRGDSDKLKQVLINLITNAVEALQGSVDPSIELRAERVDGEVSLSVIDNGPGVPSALLGSAFTPFVTSKPSGTGLGLAVVQKIARQHGGVAELIARERGTIARVRIPD